MINVNSIFIWWQLIYYSIKNFFLFYIFICFINVYVFSKWGIIFLIRQHLFLLPVLYFVTSMLIYLLDVAAKLTSLLSSLLFVISAPFVVHNILKSISLSPFIIVVSRSMTWFIAGNSSHLVEEEIGYCLFLLMSLIGLEVSAVIHLEFLILFRRYNRLQN